MRGPTTILWFRGADLRLADNAAVETAAASGGIVVPVFVCDRDAAGDWALGANSGSWLARSLDSLDSALAEKGSRLAVRSGAAERVLAEFAAEVGAERVVFSRRWEPWARAQQERVVAALGPSADTVAVPANLLVEPGDLLTGKGTAYRVFTPFWKQWRKASDEPAHLSAAPARFRAPGTWPHSEGGGIRAQAAGPGVLEGWSPGEAGALERLQAFCEEGLAGYSTGRDRPDLPGTSRLSAHLAFGEVSAARVFHEVLLAGQDLGAPQDAEAFIRQLAWREFAAHVLADEPGLPEHPVRAEFARFPWREDPGSLERWQRGETGIPIVDAGMRQLLSQGWMHNRLRMLVASLLAKDLLIPWQLGERWFWDNLVDADLANNAFGWQWVAGSGHDAAPYFRIFNPETQARRFDPDGAYVSRWLDVDHAYTEPLIDHAEARARALAAYETMKRG